MKVTYFERRAQSDLHIHASSHAFGLYVPDENVVLYSEQQGTFGSTKYSLTEDPETIKEIKAAIEGNVVQGRIKYSSVITNELDESVIKGLIQDIKIKEQLESKVEKALNEVLLHGKFDQPNLKPA